MNPFVLCSTSRWRHPISGCKYGSGTGEQELASLPRKSAQCSDVRCNRDGVGGGLPFLEPGGKFSASSNTGVGEV